MSTPWVLGFGAGSVNLVRRRGTIRPSQPTQRKPPMSQTVAPAANVPSASGQDRASTVIRRAFTCCSPPRCGSGSASTRSLAVMTLFLQDRVRASAGPSSGDRALGELPHVRLSRPHFSGGLIADQFLGYRQVDSDRRGCVCGGISPARAGLDRHVLCRTWLDL